MNLCLPLEKEYIFFIFNESPGTGLTSYTLTLGNQEIFTQNSFETTGETVPFSTKAGNPVVPSMTPGPVQAMTPRPTLASVLGTGLPATASPATTSPTEFESTEDDDDLPDEDDDFDDAFEDDDFGGDGFLDDDFDPEEDDEWWGDDFEPEEEDDQWFEDDDESWWRFFGGL